MTTLPAFNIDFLGFDAVNEFGEPRKRHSSKELNFFNKVHFSVLGKWRQKRAGNDNEGRGN